MRRVLVIEDDLSVGAAILMMLDRAGCQAVHAADANIGKNFFESTSFDLVIVDIFIPGINGLKTIAGFRQRAPTVPILAMSGFRFRDSMNPGLDFLRMAAEAGATACLRKPFAPRQLMAAVYASLTGTSGDHRVETGNQGQGGVQNGAEQRSLQHPAFAASA